MKHYEIEILSHELTKGFEVTTAMIEDVKPAGIKIQNPHKPGAKFDFFVNEESSSNPNLNDIILKMLKLYFELKLDRKDRKNLVVNEDEGGISLSYNNDDLFIIRDITI